MVDPHSPGDNAGDPSAKATLRFDEMQDPDNDPEHDPVRQFKAGSKRRLRISLFIMAVTLLLLIPVIWWVLQQPV